MTRPASGAPRPSSSTLRRSMYQVARWPEARTKSPCTTAFSLITRSRSSRSVTIGEPTHGLHGSASRVSVTGQLRGSASRGRFKGQLDGSASQVSYTGPLQRPASRVSFAGQLHRPASRVSFTGQLHGAASEARQDGLFLGRVQADAGRPLELGDRPPSGHGLPPQPQPGIAHGVGERAIADPGAYRAIPGELPDRGEGT